MAEKNSIVYKYHIFNPFISSGASWLLNSLAIVNNAAINMGVQVFLL
jgi:hypothetical protein